MTAGSAPAIDECRAHLAHFSIVSTTSSPRGTSSWGAGSQREALEAEVPTVEAKPKRHVGDATDSVERRPQRAGGLQRFSIQLYRFACLRPRRRGTHVPSDGCMTFYGES